MTSSDDSANTRRLNPFVFPSETDIRFALLVVAICLLAVNLSLSLTSLFIPDLNPGNVFSKGPPYPESGDPDYAEKLVDALLERSEQAWRSLIFPGGMVAAILALATIIYRTYPSRIRRQKGLTLLSQSDDSTLHHEIQQLIAVTGISPAPSIELGREFQQQNGQAFGFQNHYAIRLERGLRLLLRKAPSKFRAIVLHEMAHIANRDIGRTYFTQSLWISTILLVIIPLVFGVLGFQGYIQKFLGMKALDPPGWMTIVIFSLQVTGTLAIVALIRASLLRVREIYADWRAATWGAEDALTDTFLEEATHESNKAIFGRGLWRLHPTTQERLASLRNPRLLFATTPDLPILVGLVLAFIVGGMVNLILPLILIVGGAILVFAPIPGSFLLASLLANLVYGIAIFVMGFTVVLSICLVAYLVSETVGLQVQREAVAELAIDPSGLTRYLRLWVPSALMALGLEAGFYITPLAVDAPWLARGADWHSAWLTLPWLIGTIGLTWLWLIYVRFFARRVLGISVGTTPPRRSRRLVTLLSSGMLGGLYIPIISGRLVITLLSAMTIPNVEQSLTSEEILFLQGFIWATLALALSLFVFLFSATWLLVQAYRVIRPPRCPACKETIKTRYAVGRVCERCGTHLTPWLFVDKPARISPEKTGNL